MGSAPLPSRLASDPAVASVWRDELWQQLWTVTRAVAVDLAAAPERRKWE